MTSGTSPGTKIAKEAGTSFGLGIVGSVLRFLFGVLVARLLAIEWLGIYAISNSVTRIGVEVGKLGLDQGTVRYVSRLHTLGQLPKLVATLWQALRWGLLGSLIVGGVLWWNANRVGQVLARGADSSLGWTLSGFALTIPLMAAAAILAAASQGFKDLSRRTLALDVFPPSALCLVFLGLSGTVPAKWAIVAAFAVSQVVSLLGTIHYLRRSVSFDRFPITEPEPGLLSFSLPLMMTALVSSLMRFGDVILLGLLADPGVTGVYQIASRTSGLVAMLTASLIGIFAPIVSGFYAQGDTEQMRRYLKLVSRWSFSCAWPSFLFFLLYHRQMLSVLGDVFVPAGGALVLLGVSEVFWSLGAGNSMLLTMTGHPRLNLLNMIVALVVNVFGNLYWIPRFGAAGAALALAVSVGVWCLLQTAAVWKVHRMFQLSVAHLKPLAAGIVALVGSLAIRGTIGALGGVAALLTALAAFGTLYLGGLALLRIDPDDREVMASLLETSSRSRRG